MTKSTAPPSKQQLRWQCRRGMLELDVLLNHYLEHTYLNLEPQDQLRFARLLQYSDEQLWSWLSGVERADDTELQRMIEHIR